MLDQRRARTAWLKGARAFHQQNRPVALREFESAVTLDPGMADAWLGLFATESRKDEALVAMARHQDRFGEERRRNNLALTSRFAIGACVTWVLETHHQLWCAVAAMHLRDDELVEARSALAWADQNHVMTHFLYGRLAYKEGNFEESLSRFNLVLGKDDFLEAEARLLRGVMLAEKGAMGPAKENLSWVVKQQKVRALHGEARYWLAQILRVEDRPEEALAQLHEAYALNPRREGLKEEIEAAETARLQVVRAKATAAQPATSQPAVEESGGPRESVEAIVAELEAHVGQDGIKNQVRRLVAQARAELRRREHGMQSSRLTEHMLFVGPPGTGKTTIARLIARLYAALGILERPHVEEVDRSKLLAEHLGGTVAKTQARLDAAMGGILFIDEAYTLQTDGTSGGDAFGREAIDTILKRMEDDRDKFVVIAAGYPEPMEKFLDSNPGLRSRFTSTIAFEPYSVDELAEIGHKIAEESGNHITVEAVEELTEQLEVLAGTGELKKSSFGNARFVRNLIEKASAHRDYRLYGEGDVTDHGIEELTLLLSQDITAAAEELITQARPPSARTEARPQPVGRRDPERLASVLRELDDLPGLESVAAQIRQLASRVELTQVRSARGMNVAEIGLHCLFLGPPGTGKTTVARIWGQAMSALGLLPHGEITEVDRGKLVSGWIGQTAPLTHKMIDRAKGGVLFIDEAYMLTPQEQGRDHGQEAVDTLLKRMEDERGEFAVIAAGYDREMRRFLDSNSGLRSRFNHTITFPDFDAEALHAILCSMATKSDYQLSRSAEEMARWALTRLAESPPAGWANARSVRSLFDAAVSAQSIRLTGRTALSDDEVSTLTDADLRVAFQQTFPAPHS